jgi:hypothetical protein
MRWPRLFDDATYRNLRIWTWREWLTVLALGLATVVILAILLWPMVQLLIGR